METQRCRPSMAASLSRLVLARRTREAVVRSDAALTADQRLAIEASNAQLFEDAENNAYHTFSLSPVICFSIHNRKKK